VASGTTSTKSPAGLIRVLGMLVVAAGAIMLIAGAVTWFTVSGQLADEKITVSADADSFAGEKIDGPLTAYAEAQVIEKHALAASGGKTYAELAKEDPNREVVMTGSFLRSSLFTSVVSFGVAAMAMGLGVLIAIIGYALLLLGKHVSNGSPVA
jgi:hypothetical protein